MYKQIIARKPVSLTGDFFSNKVSQSLYAFGVNIDSKITHFYGYQRKFLSNNAANLRLLQLIQLL